MSEAIPVDDPVELEHAKDIRRRIDQGELIRHAFDSNVGRKPVPPLSQLGRDDDATAWMQLSHVVTNALMMATDNIRAVNEMLLPAGNLRVPLYAHYPVLRSVLEASAEAKWLLAPDDRTERIRRGLRARVSDTKEDADLARVNRETVMALTDGPDKELVEMQKKADEARHAKHMAKIKEIAAANHIEWSSIKEGLPRWIHLIRDACSVPQQEHINAVPGGYAAGVWKIMSGLSHPSTSRSAHHSFIESVSESDNGVVNARMTASLRYTSEAMTVAYNTTLEAIQLFDARCKLTK